MKDALGHGSNGRGASNLPKGEHPDFAGRDKFGRTLSQATKNSNMGTGPDRNSYATPSHLVERYRAQAANRDAKAALAQSGAKSGAVATHPAFEDYDEANFKHMR